MVVEFTHALRQNSVTCLGAFRKINLTKKKNKTERTKRGKQSCRHRFVKPHLIRKKTAQRRFRSKIVFIVKCKCLHDCKGNGKRFFPLLSMFYTELDCY